jgi:hypothetical protein
MLGTFQTVISVQDEAQVVEQFMCDFYDYCVKYNQKRNKEHQEYNATVYLTTLLNEIYNPHLSLSNEVKILPSTQLLLNEGLPVDKAFKLSHYLSKKLSAKLCLLFPDITYEQMVNTSYEFINHYDISIILTGQ